MVDDDLAIVEVLEMRLVAMGYEVTATSDAEKALNAVESTRFDLALIDLRMAPTDGIALMESVHARQPRLPVLIMTAHGTIETAVEAVQRGAFDYLTKPFLRDELRAKIGRALASRRWARDRERLLAVGQTLASSGIMARVLDAVAQGRWRPRRRSAASSSSKNTDGWCRWRAPARRRPRGRRWRRPLPRPWPRACR